MQLQARGKLLITGEYFVLDGALALAVPSLFGQKMSIEETQEKNKLSWKSIDHKGEVWFQANWAILENEFILKESTNSSVSDRLLSIFQAGMGQNETILHSLRGKRITINLDFDREWGLGTSSTLISLLAQYWNINPYLLLDKTFGGSGYDIACATANGPILYQKKDDHVAVQGVEWQPDFKDQIYFVYQGQKQNSREGIKDYRAKAKISSAYITEINNLTMAFLHAKTIEESSRVVKEHENIVSKTIQLSTVKEARFSDFPGEIKSLGAWGGDFVMVLSPLGKNKTTAYFNTKACPVVLTFDEMIFFEKK